VRFAKARCQDVETLMRNGGEMMELQVMARFLILFCVVFVGQAATDPAGVPHQNTESNPQRETPSLTSQIRDAVPDIDNIPALINRAGQNPPGYRGQHWESRPGKKRLRKKEMALISLARTVWDYVYQDLVLQVIVAAAAVVLLAYFLVWGQESSRAAEIERRLEEKRERVREIRTRRENQNKAKNPPVPITAAPKREPKPGVRLGGREVYEIIAARKAKAKAKAQRTGLPKTRKVKSESG